MCICIEPYYLNNQSVCACLHEIYPTAFILDTGDNPKCYVVPVGCSANGSGCYECLPFVHRKVTQFPDGHFSCAECEQWAAEGEQTLCSCVSNISDAVCQCPEPLYYNDTTGKCVLCP